ncbi:hypothetical protein [Paenibacillus massiliensis]|uniref:hypothetical protein n=1 Tax=Paenibacillus massiliensis TaxID=225917 RepID=UPI0003606F37|nr:hypothetical protein [Paenibacillus massiliensis]
MEVSTAESMISAIGLWLLVAGLTEAVTEVLKSLFSERLQGRATYATSILAGITLAFAFELNPFGLTGPAGIVSTVAAGILSSRGANYLNGLLKKLGIVKSKKAV